MQNTQFARYSFGGMYRVFPSCTQFLQSRFGRGMTLLVEFFNDIKGGHNLIQI